MADAVVLPGPFDPFCPAALDDPYPFYTELRRDSPVTHLAANDVWVLTRYRDVVAAWSDPATFSSAQGMGAAYPSFMETTRATDTSGALPRVSTGRNLAAADPPVHTRLRQLVAPLFTPEATVSLGQELQILCSRLIDDLLDRPSGHQDLVVHLARPLPLFLIARLLGVPLDRTADLRRWSDELLGLRPAVTETTGSTTGSTTGDTTEQTDEDRRRLRMRVRYQMWDFFDELVTERERAGADGPDVLGRLVAGPVDGASGQASGERLGHDDLVDFATLLLVAGYETSANLLSNVLSILVDQPEQFGALRADPSLVAAAVEEAARFDSPIQGLFRWTTAPARFGDVEIPAGQAVWGLFASANRDETHFPGADRFDPTRSPNDHLGFGWGSHLCLGGPLARLTARTALDTLASRTRSITPAGERTRTGNPVMRGLASLPAEVVAR